MSDDGCPGDDESSVTPVGPTMTDQRSSRRKLVLGLVGAGLGATACTPLFGAVAGSPLTPGRAIAPDGAVRLVGERPAAGGGFADRDESYSKGAGSPAGSAVPAETSLFAGPAAAAAGTRVTVPTILDTSAPELHLVRRFTFGATPELVAEVRAKGIDRWLGDQLTPATVDDADGDRVWSAFRTASMTTAQIRGAVKKYSWDAMFGYAQATLARQIWSRRQVFEVMVDFWANHLNVPMPSDGAWDVGTSYHNDVIRRHALGGFAEMLAAAMRHPAMLRYLSNDQSHRRSVNENLGRELLELHTVGIGADYSESDVRNSAYILTGRTVAEDGSFSYDAGRHWTGAVAVLGFRDANASAAGGLDVGDRYVAYLAHHPATAKMIARKLCVRFVADSPPQALVDRLAQTYLDNATLIIPVLHELLCSREFWASVGQKVRRPLENVVASARVLGVRPGADIPKGVTDLYWGLDQLGHQPLHWGPPNGYPDVAGAWASSGAMLQLWNRHRGLVQGWSKNLVHTKPEQLLGGAAPAGAAAYVDALSERLVQQRLRPAHRAALLEFLGKEAGSTASATRFAPHLAPLLLDSPYFALR